MTAPANVASAGTLPTAAAARRARARLVGGLGFYAFVVAFVVFCLAPFVWTLLTSFKGPTTIVHSKTTPWASITLDTVTEHQSTLSASGAATSTTIIR